MLILVACRSHADAGSALVASISTEPLTLTPPFSPTIHDYYVRCGAGKNMLSIAATAGADATVALARPVTTAPAASVTANGVLSENEAAVVSASNGTETEEYWVRCLPHDFPRLRMVVHPAAGVPTPGYYLLGNATNASGESGYAMVLDADGVPVWYSRTSNGNDPVDVESLAPNAVSFVAYLYYTFSEASWKYEIHDLGTDAVDYVEPGGEPLDLHELQALPNGDYLVLSDPITTGVDLTGLGAFGLNESMVGCDAQEVSPGGTVVWQWSATDHFDPVKDSTFPGTGTASGVPVVDPFHCNSIDVAADGDLLISSRNMDSVFLVSKATGKVVWKMGGATYTRDGATYLTVTGDPQTSFYRQHDARFLPNGQISLFDDATSTPGAARGVVYSYDVNAGTASFVWQYRGTVNSAAMGSFRVLSDGSRIIGWGEGGQPQLAFTEVDASGNDLLDFDFTDGDQSYRALKVPLTQLDIGLMRNSVSGFAPDGGAVDTGAEDGGTQDATSPVEAGAGCHTISGSGASEQCSYSVDSAADGGCSIEGALPGACPASGLYGCCVESVWDDGGANLVDATCYYSSTTGQPAASQCAFEAYDGLPYDWQTFAP
ncbi:MAG TPA: arylsulfotransferase family protein [Polyangiaceae bacterium]